MTPLRPLVGRLGFFWALLVTVALFLCPASGATQPALASASTPVATIDIVGAASPPGFDPSYLTVHAGDEVAFENDSPADTYTILASDGTFHSPAIGPGQQWSMTVTAIGAHEYREQTHPQTMVGVIDVEESDVTLLPTPNAAAQATQIAAIRQAATRANQSNTSNSPIGTLFIVLAIVVGVILVGGAVVVVLRR